MDRASLVPEGANGNSEMTLKQTDAAMKFDGKVFLKTVSHSPGVYLMVDSDGKYLYVGKAKNLQRRLGSYFRRSGLPDKTKLMMSQVSYIETRITHTEREALLLENDLIKEKTPRYNVIYRDDKSYPYIRVTTDHLQPGISFYRGSLKQPGTFFGPYSSVAAVREILSQLQKVIPVRHCSDNYFSNRSRPCLQYQIKRCSGPCVGLVDPGVYADDVRQVIMLLEGRDDSLAELFTERDMQGSLDILDSFPVVGGNFQLKGARAIKRIGEAYRVYSLCRNDRSIAKLTVCLIHGIAPLPRLALVPADHPLHTVRGHAASISEKETPVIQAEDVAGELHVVCYLMGLAPGVAAVVRVCLPQSVAAHYGYQMAVP